MHEFKALHDWAAAYYVQFEVLAATNNFYQIAIRIV